MMHPHPGLLHQPLDLRIVGAIPHEAVPISDVDCIVVASVQQHEGQGLIEARQRVVCRGAGARAGKATQSWAAAFGSAVGGRCVFCSTVGALRMVSI